MYRIYTEGYWQSQAGNAIVAITNKTGSGKLVKIYTVAVQTNTSLGLATYLNNIFASYKITALTGEQNTSSFKKLDTTSPNIPSEIRVGKYGIVTSTNYDNGNYFKKFTYNQNLGVAANGQTKVMGAGLIGNNSQIQYSENLTTSTPITLNQNQGISIMPYQVRNSCYYRIDCTFVMDTGTASYTYFCTEVSALNSYDTPLFSIFNGHGTYTVKILRLNMAEMGDNTTPFFMLVPIAGVSQTTIDDPYRQGSIIKYDSNDSSISSTVGIYYDTPVSPYGVPDSYLSQASISNPKGMNYLNIKDFIGPLYQVQFAELYTNTWTDGLLTTMGCANKSRDANTLFSSPNPIILNEGEGVAIVSAAENVLAATNMVNLTSWGSYAFGIDLNVSDLTATLLITGIQPSSDVQVLSAGTTATLTGSASVTSTFSWTYTVQPNFYVDIIIASLQYVYYRLETIQLTSAGVTIPVVQQYDRNYYNP